MADIEPRIGAVYVCNHAAPARYIIIDVRPIDSVTGAYARLDLVAVHSRKIVTNFECRLHANEDDFVTIEPLLDGEETLFMQAMLAPQTLERDDR